MKRTVFVLIAAFCFLFSSTAQDATALYNEGVELKNERRSKEAIEKFKEAIKLKPDYYAAQYELGWCSNDTKDYTTALASLRKARVGWGSVPKVFFELGYAFEKLNMYDSAINSYNKCLSLKSDYSLAYKQLGTIDYNKDNYQSALQYFVKYEAATRNEITDYLYWYRKGFMQNALKDHSAAKISLNSSLQFKKDYINTYLELGFACNKLKEGDDAINWFNEAMKLDAKSHIPYNGIAEVYRDTKKDIDMAMTWYQKSLAVKTDERKACFGMGYCLNSKDRYSEAIPYLKKAIQQEPTYTAAYVEIGYSYYMSSNNTEAISNLKKALQLNDKNENARFYLGLVYINQKDKLNAQQMVTELKSLNSKNAAKLEEKVNKM